MQPGRSVLRSAAGTGFCVFLLLMSTALHAGTTTDTIAVGKYPITITDPKTGAQQTEDLYIDVETEVFICDEQKKKVGTYRYDLGKVACERHCLACPVCGGPGKDQCGKDHSLKREVPVKECTQTIGQIVEAAKRQVLKDLHDKKSMSAKGKSVYLFRPNEKGNILADLDTALAAAVKDGESSHPDFKAAGEHKGTISVGAQGHVGICEKGENQLGYEQAKYEVTVHIKITIRLVKYLVSTDPASGKPKKDHYGPKEDKEVFSYTYDRRMPVGFRYEYAGKTSGWRITDRCTCCGHESRGEPVSTKPASFPVTPVPVAPPAPKQEEPVKEPETPKKTGHEYRGEGTQLPSRGAYGSFVIAPDTTVAVRADGATSSFVIDEEGKKTQDLEQKGKYFVGKLPRLIAGGIVTGGIITAIITTSAGDRPAVPRGIVAGRYYDGTAAPSLETGIPRIDPHNLERYNLSATIRGGTGTVQYGSPNVYLIDNATGSARAIFDLGAREPLPPGTARFTFTGPAGDVIDEKNVSVYSYGLSFTPARVTRGVPVTGNGSVSGLDGATPIEVTVSFDPILGASVTGGRILRQVPGSVTFETTADGLNANPADFTFDTSKGLGKQDVTMTVTPKDRDR